MRKLILEVETTLPEGSWIWDSLGQNKVIHGVKVKSIAESTHYKVSEIFDENDEFDQD